MSKYTRGLLAVILAVVLVLPAAAFAMLPEANARSSTGMDGPTVSGPTVVDPDTSGRWEKWAADHSGNKVTTQNVGRIWTDKTVEATGENEESDFLTTLSAMSSTSNSTVTVTTPLDIVMVLDASGSMNDPMGRGDKTERIEALKNAANSFIDTIAKQNEGIEGVDRQHKVAIVKFAGNETDKVGNDTYRSGGHSYNYSQTMQGLTACTVGGAKSLKETIDSIRPAGATRADYGMKQAEKNIKTSGRADAKKIVVFFTDGTPTSFSDFDSKVANDAVTAAKNMKDGKATVYTIGIFSGANPGAGIQDLGTDEANKANKFMQAVSSNYPNATAWDTHGTRAENSDYYKSATNAEELKKVFDDISQAITSEAPYPTEIHKGYDETKSGYITFTDELGDFMQVDGFTEVVINGTPFTEASKTFNEETNTDTYEFTGKAKDLLITVQRAGDDNPQKGDIVTVNIPASLIPLSHFKTVDGKLSVDSVKPIQVKYASSVKSVALDNLFTPEKVMGLKTYIEKNTTVADDGSKTVSFYANKWKTGALGDTVANFEPADTNRYYYFQKQTPIYTDKECTQPAKISLAEKGTYYYKDEFEEQGENNEAKSATAVIEFIGGDAAKFDGAIVRDKDDNLSFSVGTARLAFIDELHTTKEGVGGNLTETALDVLNPRWNNVSAKATATHVNSYLGNNGKISYKYDMTPAKVDTKASFGLTKVLEGREWTKEDKFEFGLTSENGAPMPKSTTAVATQGNKAIDFGEITYTEPGTYVYKVSEKNAGQTIDGITYSGNVAEITVTVTPNKKGELSADVQVTSGETEFKNTYAANSVDSSVTDKIKVTKVLTGRDLKAGEFSFELREAKGEDSELIETVKNDANGNVTFKAIRYTEIGQHTYTLREVKGNAGGVTYDENFYIIVTTISDNGKGQLVATHKLKGAEDVKSIKFKNAYTANAAEASLAGIKNLQFADGLTPADIAGKFTFTVTADEAGAPMPERTTATNDAAGNVDFGKIHFTLEDLNRALGVTDDATDKAEADEADEAEADEAEAEEADADADVNADEPSDESEPAAPTAPRSHTFTYTVTESGSASGVTNDVNATRKVSYTVTDDGAGHLSVVRNGDDGAAFTFTNTYSVTPTDSSVTDQVKTVKRLTGRDLAAGEFTFDLLEDGVTVASGTNDANGNVTLSPIRYEAPGTHTYTLREACPNALGLYKGVTYDGTTYTVVTTVSDNGDGTLTATHKLEGTTESAGFTNKYHAMPTQVSIGAIKVLEGRELKKDEFSFKLVGEDIESTVTNDADGKINFDKFEYDEPGTYVYTISEVKGDEAGMTYDKSVFTATVNVVDDGEGNLKANVAFTKGDKSVEGIVFNNTYKKPETPVPTPDPGTPKTVTNIVKTVKGFLPTTGDQQAAALLMAFVIAMAGVGALVWGIRKR